MPGRARFRAAVVVSGDLARSPRMMYHAEALAQELADVELIGRGGTPLPAAIAEHPHIRCRILPGGRWRARGALRLPLALARSALEAIALLRALLRCPRGYALMLLQAPPAFPAIWALSLARRRRGGAIVVDWHNFGSSLLARRGGAAAGVSPLLELLEKRLAASAGGQLCVSRAMSDALLARGAPSPPPVFYDRPSRRFRPAGEPERRELRERFAEAAGTLPLSSPIVASPSSWTPDEDHALLLESLAILDRAPGAGGPAPRLGLLLTGKGEGRAPFEAALRRSPPRLAAVATLWLTAEDYFRLLGAADAGLCLHRSASGVDLPMKIADLRGSGLPVLALRSSAALPEVFSPERDGALFESAEELAALLASLADPSSALSARFRALREIAPPPSRQTWQQGWEREARPLLEAAARAARPC